MKGKRKKQYHLLSPKADFLKPSLAKAEEAGGDPEAFRKHVRMLVERVKAGTV